MTLVTNEPTWMDPVETAAAVSNVQHSSNGSVSRPRLTKWSHAHTDVTPAVSSRRAASIHQAPLTPMVVRLTPIGIGTARIVPRSRSGPHGRPGLERDLDHPVGRSLQVGQAHV